MPPAPVVVDVPTARLRSDTIWCVESPGVDGSGYGPRTIELAGWVATPEPQVRASLRTGPDGEPVVIELTPRADVTETFALPAWGWCCTIDRDDVRLDRRGALTIELEIGDDRLPLVIPTKVPPAHAAGRTKRDRLLRILRCVECGGRVVDGLRTSRCRSCRVVVGRRGQLPFDFLGRHPDLRAAAQASQNVSSNEYDPFTLDLLRRNPDALFLDCGAGSRSMSFANVVNVEIAKYPSTDVLATGDDLPFEDASFDGVLSFAVLEHVRDPFGCAAELMRVLRPGGVLYAQVPFLQPVHAYPHHYYNMTQAGLEGLFTGLHIVQSGVFPFGQPVFLLSWFLNRYAAGLPDGERQRFADLRVADLLEPGHAYLGAPFVTELSEEARAELACANFLLARKPA